MKRLPFVFFLLVFFLVGCGTSEGAEVPASATATLPAATATPEAPTGVAPTATPETPPTESPTEQPAEADLEQFINELQLAATNADYASLAATLGSKLAVGAWRSEWREYSPDEVISGFQSGSLPAPAGVQFSGLTVAELSDAMAQPIDRMFAPGIAIVATLHSTGWGPNGTDEAILFVAESDGAYRWFGFLYTEGRFADAYLAESPAPTGLIYHTPDSGWQQIGADGTALELLPAAQTLYSQLSVSPDGRHAAYLNDAGELWLIELPSGTERRLAVDYAPIPYFAWGDNQTLFAGIWLDMNEAEGPNNGHISLVDIVTDGVTILVPDRLSGHRPALASDGRVALDLYPSGPDDKQVAFIYSPESGLAPFVAAEFEVSNKLLSGVRFNPAWSPDGRQIAWLATNGETTALQLFDLENKRARQLLSWEPARFGGLVPSPSWSPDGQWLALDVLANGYAGSGLWLLAADGSSTRQLDRDGSRPHWLAEGQLVYALRKGEPRLYDLATGTMNRLDLPAGSVMIGLARPQLVAAPFGLVYRRGNEWWRVDEKGVNQLLITHDGIVSLNPSATRAVFARLGDSELRFYDLVSGVETSLPLQGTLLHGSRHMPWLDEERLVLILSDDASEEGSGRLALFNILNGELSKLEIDLSFYSQPAITREGAISFVRLDGEPFIWQLDALTPLPLEAYWSHPVVSPTGEQLVYVEAGDPGAYYVYNFATQDSVLVHTFLVIGTDALISYGMSWSPDGAWLTLAPPAFEGEGSGIWLISADLTTKIHLGDYSQEPIWLNNEQLVFQQAEGDRLVVQRFDVVSRQTVTVDLPAGAVPWSASIIVLEH